ncbi:MAG: alpha/beta hydrolase [Acidobacteriia bacterium]|nr:alpha/beta hydrolase [Terriglobia bacterium]
MMSSELILDRKVKEFLRLLAVQDGPHLYEVPLDIARAMAVIGQLRFPVPRIEADVEDREIEIGSQGRLRIRIVRPVGSRGKLPGIMYFHGGGWVVNDRDTHDRLVREIAYGSEAAVVFVEYSRSPEARYPTAIEEAYAATCWVAQHGASIGVDPERIAVMGDSAGGNMATVVTLLARQRGGPKILAQVLFYPTTDCNFETLSYQQFGKDYFLTREDMQWFWNEYAPDPNVRLEPTASPLRASLEHLKGLPRALIITGECDVVRDEGEAYARQLARAGVEVTATRYLGMIHGFTFLNVFADLPAAKAAIAQATGMLRSIFAVSATETMRSNTELASVIKAG